MERKVVIVCCVVGFLGLLSAVTGFAAEAKRIKGDQVQFPSPSECIYPRSPALGLGLTAAVALMIAQMIINVATGCVCCRKGPHQTNSNWTLALVCFIVSWFTFVIAFLLLLTGAALNDQHGEENLYFGNYYCYVVKPGVFAGAAVLSLASVILGIIYYVTLTQEKAASVPQSGIAMGHPHFPPQYMQSRPQFPPPQNVQSQPQISPPQNAQGPVFVHEDTYMRRQFT
ncbi:uncharacterized protein LOC105160232 [Sesamum indicum]|uniref:Uncharacterized protein LOC105160232 n=1 Tax=Sesamum indicum TaxID=4182 RepID=A0A6I9T5X9_SESIN|nr:uncharacterized protein LOC105160232 [Sesamum indicum]